MSDPTPAADNAATNSGLVLTTEQLAAIVAALAGAVQTGVSQAMSQASQEIAKQVSESISGSTDSDSGYLVRTSIDPGASQRRLESLAEMSVADAVKFRAGVDAIMIRKLSQDTDHHSSLPPMTSPPAPKAA